MTNNFRITFNHFQQLSTTFNNFENHDFTP